MGHVARRAVADQQQVLHQLRAGLVVGEAALIVFVQARRQRLQGTERREGPLGALDHLVANDAGRMVGGLQLAKGLAVVADQFALLLLQGEQVRAGEQLARAHRRLLALEVVQRRAQALLAGRLGAVQQIVLQRQAQSASDSLSAP